MAITIGNYNFESPFNSTNDLRSQSGVYAILGRNAHTESWNVVDIGESGDVKTRVSNHDRAECWKQRRYQQLTAAAHYRDAQSRIKVEQELRAQYNPPCGER